MSFSLSAGWIVAIIFLVIAVLVILALFLPLKYRLDADIDEKKVDFGLKYFGFIRFRFAYDEDIEAVLKIFFLKIDLIKFLGKLGKKRKKKKSGKKVEKTTLEKIKGGASAAKRILSGAGEYDLMAAVMPPFKKFLFKLRPRRVCGRIEFGFADPSTTGYVTGAIAVLPLVYQTDLAVLPDFEADETYIKGNIHAAGHGRLAAVIALAVGIIAQKNVRGFIGAVRKKS